MPKHQKHNKTKSPSNKKTNRRTLKPLWFEDLLVISNKHLGLYLHTLQSICGKLLGLCRGLSITMLLLTTLYAWIIWRNVPDNSPKILLIGWAVCLLLTDLGKLALDGKNAKPIRGSIIMIVILYWLPVAPISKILQSL